MCCLREVVVDREHSVPSVWYVVPRDGWCPLFPRITPGLSPEHAWKIWEDFISQCSDESKKSAMNKKKYVARRFSLTLRSR